MFGILSGGGKDVKATGIAQRIDRKVNAATLTSDIHRNFTPVMRERAAGLSAEVNGFLTRAHFAFWLNVIPQHGTPTGIAITLISWMMTSVFKTFSASRISM